MSYPFPLVHDTVREGLFGGRRRLYGTIVWQDQRHRLSAFVDERVYSSEGPELRGTRHPVLNPVRQHGGVLTHMARTVGDRCRDVCVHARLYVDTVMWTHRIIHPCNDERGS